MNTKLTISGTDLSVKVENASTQPEPGGCDYCHEEFNSEPFIHESGWYFFCSLRCQIIFESKREQNR